MADSAEIMAAQLEHYQEHRFTGGREAPRDKLKASGLDTTASSHQTAQGAFKPCRYIKGLNRRKAGKLFQSARQYSDREVRPPPRGWDACRAIQKLK